MRPCVKPPACSTPRIWASSKPAGPHALPFLDTVTTNDVSTLAIGQSHYTYLLLPDGSVVDDLMVYRRGPEQYMLVVNASNNDKDWAWLNAVNEGRVQIDAERPFARIQHPATLRDLRDPAHGADCRVDIPLQGPQVHAKFCWPYVEDRATWRGASKACPGPG